jgi:hypothetical protein
MSCSTVPLDGVPEILIAVLYQGSSSIICHPSIVSFWLLTTGVGSDLQPELGVW